MHLSLNPLSVSSVLLSVIGVLPAQELPVPDLNVYGNFVGRLDDRSVVNDAGDGIDDRFSLRAVEIEMEMEVSSWMDAYVVLAIEAESPGKYETAIEEGNLFLHDLPDLASAPVDLSLRVGRMRPQFGQYNRLHIHDLPQTTRPHSLQTLLGEEGLVQDGFALGLGVGNAACGELSLTTALLNGGDIAIAEDNAGEDPAVVSRLAWAVDMSQTTRFELGASVFAGRADMMGDLQARLYGADFSFHWRPQDQQHEEGEQEHGDLHGHHEHGSALVLAGELYYADVETLSAPSLTPLGGFVWGQYLLFSQLHVGGRFDYSESLADDNLETRSTSVFFTHQTSENLAFRLGYERFHSDQPSLDGMDTIYIEMNFAFGSSHPMSSSGITGNGP